MSVPIIEAMAMIMIRVMATLTDVKNLTTGDTKMPFLKKINSIIVLKTINHIELLSKKQALKTKNKKLFLAGSQ